MNTKILETLKRFTLDDPKRNLRGVVVEKDRAWATDGHRGQILFHNEYRMRPCPPPGVYVQSIVGPDAGWRIDPEIIPPPLDAVIPESPKFFGKIPVKALAWHKGALPQLDIFPRERTWRAFQFRKDGTVMLAVRKVLTKEREERMTAEEIVAHDTNYRWLKIAETGQNFPFELAVQARYLAEAVAALDVRTDNVELYADSALDPLKIATPSGVSVIMPVRL